MKTASSRSNSGSAERQQLSEASLAAAFTKQFGSDYLFDHQRGRWYRWTGQYWNLLEVPIVFNRLRELAHQLGRGSIRVCRAQFVAGAQRFAEADPRHAVTSETWNRDPWLLATPGGTVDLRSGRLRRARKADRLTKLASCAPGRGDPSAWLRFLREANNGDDEMAAYLQRLIGYLLTGVTSEHAFFFIHGPGGNGKSVFVNTLIKILGDYAATAPMETFTKTKFTGHPTELAMLDGARMVSAIETEAGHVWSEARIKSITGGDRISARLMRRDFFSFTPVCKLFFVGNYQPVLTSPDPAMARRLHMISFTNRPAKPDPHLEEKLLREAPQILRWAIDGCLEWQRCGLARPTSVTSATEEYLRDQDIFGQWLEERCETGRGGWERPATLYEDWCRFAREIGEAEGTMKAFSDRMKRVGLMSTKVGGIRGYRNVQLRTWGQSSDRD